MKASDPLGTWNTWNAVIVDHVGHLVADVWLRGLQTHLVHGTHRLYKTLKRVKSGTAMSSAAKAFGPACAKLLVALLLFCVLGAAPVFSQGRCPLEFFVAAGTAEAIGNCDSSESCDKLIQDALFDTVVPTGGIAGESEERLDAQMLRSVEMYDDTVRNWDKWSSTDRAAAVSDYMQSEGAYNRLPERFSALLARRTRMLEVRTVSGQGTWLIQAAFTPKLVAAVVWHSAVLRSLSCVSDQCQRARQAQVAKQYEWIVRYTLASWRWRRQPPLFQSVLPLICPRECTPAVRVCCVLRCRADPARRCARTTCCSSPARAYSAR